jgi:ATP-binding cassette subfamily F protein uup
VAVLDVQGLSLAFGGAPLLDGVNLSLEAGERVALVGRNGTGKSSLLKVLHGDVAADEGEILGQARNRIALLPQWVPPGIEGDVYDVVAEGLGQVGELAAEHHHLSVELAQDASPRLLKRLDELHHALEEAGGWQLPSRVEAVLTRLELDGDARFEELSGGLQRRVLLGRALVSEPNVLLLDEPTNHLDVTAIEALEESLLTFPGALLFVTHDRAFLRRLATRILELDRGRLTSWPGDYDAYLEGKEKELEVEAQHHALFDKKLAQEEAWIRQGIKARRTRNEGRVRALERMREERRARRQVVGDVRMRLASGERSGKRVLEAEGVTFSYSEGANVVEGFSVEIQRGDKIGILGPNGSGKTTLLRLLLGELEPQAGTIRHGTRLEVAYFDQHREPLDPQRTVADTVGDGNDRVTVAGQNRHIIGYLQDFLFPPDRARSPVSALSGGERNRLLLARLFTRSFNVLVMDEPTNDLDAETLEVLEDLLLEFKGTLLLVSHDRAFLDNVVTSTLVFEGQGRIGEYVGGYSDWLHQRAAAEAEAKAAAAKTVARETAKPRAKAAAPGTGFRRRTYKEEKELEGLPARIEALEGEREAQFVAMADPDFYRQEGPQIVATQERLASLEKELATVYARWEHLEGLQPSR